MVQHLYVGMFMDFIQQGPLNFIARSVFIVQNTVIGMTAFAGQVKIALRIFIKVGAPRNQFPYPLGSLSYHFLYNAGVAQAIAGNKCVLNVAFKRIGFLNHPGDSALGILGVAFAFGSFGDKGNFDFGLLTEMLGYFISKAQAGYARTYDQKIGVCGDAQ